LVIGRQAKMPLLLPVSGGHRRRREHDVCDHAGRIAALAACFQVDHIWVIGRQLQRVALDESARTS
jgi:predicted SPOUT superfamily RNA methylase MTH1